MFVPTPATSIVAFRVREKMRRDIEREAKKRKLQISEEVRRRLKFYADHHAADKPRLPRRNEVQAGIPTTTTTTTTT